MISITDGLQAIYNSNMREKTPLELERENRMLKQQIQELTNNWNELEEWLKADCKELYRDAGYRHNIICEVLDKMKEIKENNKCIK